MDNQENRADHFTTIYCSNSPFNIVSSCGVRFKLAEPFNTWRRSIRLVCNFGWNMDNVGCSYMFDSSSVFSLVAKKEKQNS